MKAWIATMCAVSVAGCAMSPQQFARDRSKMSDTAVCQEALKAEEAKNEAFRQVIWTELNARGVTVPTCVALIQKDRDNLMTGLAILAGVAVVAAAARGGGGGGAAPASSSASAVDTEWAWDQFQNQYGQLVWECRGKQTAQFAPNRQCDYKPKIDTTWPGVRAPN